MLIKIIGAIAALALGIWLGLPGRYQQNDRDIERAMDQGGARRNTVKKVFTPLDWFSRSQRGSSRRREPSRFSTAASTRSDDRRPPDSGDRTGDPKESNRPEKPAGE